VNIDFLKYLPTTFTSSGIGAMTPGTYTVGVYYKKTGTTDWKAFTNGNYQNFATITVVGDDQNPLETIRSNYHGSIYFSSESNISILSLT
jgi:hypothetical protein